MGGAELLDAVKGSPVLLAFVGAVLALTYAIEKLSGLAGPVSRAIRAWHDRELNRLRREALLRAEQRRIDREDEDERVRELRAEVDWLNRERADQRRRDRARDHHDRQLAAYLGFALRQARRAGINLPDPPRPPDLAPLYVDGDEAELLDDDGPTTSPLRRESARPPVPGR